MQRVNLKSEIAAVYMPCRAIIEQQDGVRVVGMLTGVVYNRFAFVANATETVTFLDFGNTWVQLILTPLSEISDEHAVGLSKVYGHNEPLAILGKKLIEFCFADDEEINEISVQDGMRVTDYLRSLGYDCGHGSIKSLIESGIAISYLN